MRRIHIPAARVSGKNSRFRREYLLPQQPDPNPLWKKSLQENPELRQAKVFGTNGAMIVSGGSGNKHHARAAHSVVHSYDLDA